MADQSQQSYLFYWSFTDCFVDDILMYKLMKNDERAFCLLQSKWILDNHSFFELKKTNQMRKEKRPLRWSFSHLRWRCVRDSNPWSPPWQGGTITNFANAPWSRWRELNPRVHLGKVAFYHWTTAAWRFRRESNSRSPPWQGGMLTATPRNHFWRRRRDLNPRAGHPTYALSRGTSSASWVLLHSCQIC